MSKLKTRPHLTDQQSSIKILDMIVHKSKAFWIAGSTFLLTFAVLFSIRLGILEKVFFRPRSLSMASIDTVSERNTWMNIFQGERKIGFSHTRFEPAPTGYRLIETVYMRINTMGMTQNISLNTKSRLNPDFTLQAVDFEISSGRFRFSVKGTVDGNSLQVTTRSAGASRQLEIQIKEKLYLMNGIMDAVAAASLISVAAVGGLALIPVTVAAWVKDWFTVGGRVLYTVLALLAPVLLWWAWYWNLLGWQW